jgi:hypothetical protein
MIKKKKEKEKKNCEDFGSWGGQTTPVAHGDCSTTLMAKEREREKKKLKNKKIVRILVLGGGRTTKIFLYFFFLSFVNFNFFN